MDWQFICLGFEDQIIQIWSPFSTFSEDNSYLKKSLWEVRSTLVLPLRKTNRKLCSLTLSLSELAWPCSQPAHQRRECPKNRWILFYYQFDITKYFLLPSNCQQRRQSGSLTLSVFSRPGVISSLAPHSPLPSRNLPPAQSQSQLLPGVHWLYRSH